MEHSALPHRDAEHLSDSSGGLNVGARACEDFKKLRADSARNGEVEVKVKENLVLQV
jgi:hypothetical protein